ncbi:hypothetical protein H4218_006280, partial [Coemansia sp. IMI 209128]
MLATAFSAASLLTFALLATTTNAHPQPQSQEHGSNALAKRRHGCGMCGGYGFPFAASLTNDFDRNSNRAQFNENTLFINNVNANAANDN